MDFRLRFGVLLIAAAAFAGCSNDDSGSGGNDSPQGGEETQRIDIEDQWESNCVDTSTLGLSQTTRLEFSGSTATSISRIHNNGTCSSEMALLEQTGTFIRGTERSPNVFDIDLTRSTAAVTPTSARGAEILRIAGFCGYTDWAVGVKKDVTDRTSRQPCVPKLPRTEYDIYSVENDSLFFGKGLDKTDPARRPTELNREITYSRR